MWALVAAGCGTAGGGGAAALLATADTLAAVCAVGSGARGWGGACAGETGAGWRVALIAAREGFWTERGGAFVAGIKGGTGWAAARLACYFFDGGCSAGGGRCVGYGGEISGVDGGGVQVEASEVSVSGLSRGV